MTSKTRKRLTTQAEQAMVLLDTWGSTSYLPGRLQRKDPSGNNCSWGWAEHDYAPEWLERSELEPIRHDECITVLHNAFGDLHVPWGYRVAYRGVAGERACPHCEELSDDSEDQQQSDRCKLCEGSRVVYWGEEWQVVVLAPTRLTVDRIHLTRSGYDHSGQYWGVGAPVWQVVSTDGQQVEDLLEPLGRKDIATFRADDYHMARKILHGLLNLKHGVVTA